MKHIHHSDTAEYWHQSQREHSSDEHLSATSVHSHQAAITVKPSRDEIARKAYEIYREEGCPQGRDVQHWLDAELQLRTFHVTHGKDGRNVTALTEHVHG